MLTWLVNQQNKENQRLDNFGTYNKLRLSKNIIGNINRDSNIIIYTNNASIFWEKTVNVVHLISTYRKKEQKEGVIYLWEEAKHLREK